MIGPLKDPEFIGQQLYELEIAFHAERLVTDAIILSVGPEKVADRINDLIQAVESSTDPVQMKVRDILKARFTHLTQK